MSAQQRRVAWVLSATCLVAGLAFAPRTPAMQSDVPTIRITQVDSSQFPRVTVYVSILDAKGEPVAVDPAGIVLAEDGKSVTPTDVHALGGGQPLTSMLVIDVSGSMNKAGKLDAARAAARAYVNQMQPGDETGVMSFNTQTTVVQPVTSDRQALLAAISGLKAEGDTAMYDALGQAEQSLASVGGRKAIIVLTDGMDNRSRLTADAVIRNIGPGGLSLSAIGMGEPSQGTSSLAGLDEARLQSLAVRAGGTYSYVNDAITLQALYRQLGRALHSEYAITYQSASHLRDGVNRSLTVSLAQASAGAAGQARFNPGGLVPEVPQPAPWPVFVGLLGALALLVVAPGLIGRGAQALTGRQRSVKEKSAHIRLHDQPAPRVRLH